MLRHCMCGSIQNAVRQWPRTAFRKQSSQLGLDVSCFELCAFWQGLECAECLREMSNAGVVDRDEWYVWTISNTVVIGVPLYLVWTDVLWDTAWVLFAAFGVNCAKCGNGFCKYTCALTIFVQFEMRYCVFKYERLLQGAEEHLRRAPVLADTESPNNDGLFVSLFNQLGHFRYSVSLF